MKINRPASGATVNIPTIPGVLWNPFRMGDSGREEQHRDAVVTTHRAWMAARNVGAHHFLQREGGLAVAVPAIAPRGRDRDRVGSEAWEAAHRVAAAGRGVSVIRLECTPACARHARKGTGCHGFAVAEAVRRRLRQS